MHFLTKITPPSVQDLKSWLLDHSFLINIPVPGFKGNAVAANIRKDGRIDMGLLASDVPAQIAGIFTQNKLQAAPIMVSRNHLLNNTGRAILVNSGCANAAYGEEGLEACLSTCRTAAQALNVDLEDIFPCSTGVIGQGLPYEKMNAKMSKLVTGLQYDGLILPAQAMMTTDAFAKMAQATVNIGGKKITLLGMAKGAGMIRPDMATMLAFILTDAKMEAAQLQQVIRHATGASFNRASVDGDTSTNDTLLIMANGLANNAPLTSEELQQFQNEVTLICQKMAAMMVMDGEGAEHLILVQITGAASMRQAYESCYAIAHSPLCKTAFNGCDPNWGRLCSTLGAVGARGSFPYEQHKISLHIGPVLLLENGQYQGLEAEKQAAAIMKEKIYNITLDLGQGNKESWIFTNDLGHNYITINADYRS